jgi:hypothetical protein
MCCTPSPRAKGSDPHELHTRLNSAVEADWVDDGVWGVLGGHGVRPEEAGGESS